MDDTGAGAGGEPVAVRPGRRERKKQETRRRLELAALDLFEAHGYDATTVEDITEAADVAVRTFFRYFPSKEALLVGPTEEAVAALAVVLDARPSQEDPWSAAVGSLRALRTDALVAQQDEALRRLRLTAAVPAARAGVLESYARWEQVLVEHLRARDAGADDLELRVVAAGAMAAFRVAVETWVAGGGREPLEDLFAAAAQRLGDGLAPVPN